MSANINGGVIVLTETEKNELEWYARHHKGNVAYLATRIKQLIDEPDNEEYRKFFYGHFGACIDEFLKSIYPIMQPTTGNMIVWDERNMLNGVDIKEESE